MKTQNIISKNSELISNKLHTENIFCTKKKKNNNKKRKLKRIFEKETNEKFYMYKIIRPFLRLLEQSSM